MNTKKREARIAGLIYILIVITAPFSMMYIPSVLFVNGDATATMNNIHASELLFRVGVVCDLITHILFALVVLALYHLLKDVNHRLAVLMAVLALVSVPIAFANTLNLAAPLALSSGPDFLSSFDKQQADALAYSYLRLRWHGIMATSVFWGLWLLPFGLLVYRSGFIPRVFGVLLWVAGLAYVIHWFVTLLSPALGEATASISMVLQVGEVPIVFWLLIKGVRDQPSAGQAPRPGNRIAVA